MPTSIESLLYGIVRYQVVIIYYVVVGAAYEKHFINIILFQLISILFFVSAIFG